MTPIEVDPVPRQGNLLSAALGRTMLKLLRWRIEGDLPRVPRCILIVAPHTSNWDFVVALGAKLALRLRASWLGKASLFVFPFRGLLRFIGGIPVDRVDPTGVVDSAIAGLRREPQVFLALTPEGTRSRVARWKTGFHRIARGAGVPICAVRLDYSRRVLGLGPLLETSDDVEGDLTIVQGWFNAAMARQPEKY